MSWISRETQDNHYEEGESALEPPFDIDLLTLLHCIGKPLSPSIGPCVVVGHEGQMGRQGKSIPTRGGFPHAVQVQFGECLAKPGGIWHVLCHVDIVAHVVVHIM